MNRNTLIQMLNDGLHADFMKAVQAQPSLTVEEPGLLIKAVNLSAKECVDVLLQCGADANPHSDSPFAAGKSLLLMAIGFGDFEIARLLLAYGSDPHAGFNGPPDYGIFLAKYSPTGLLTDAQYNALVEDIRAGNNPVARDFR